MLITLLALTLAALGIVPTAVAMLAGAAALVLTGCLSMEDAYRAIEWRVVVLIAGMLPIGTALVDTGLAAQIGRAFTTGLASAGPLADLRCGSSCPEGSTPDPSLTKRLNRASASRRGTSSPQAVDSGTACA